MSSYLSEILGIVTEILDTTLKTVTIPDKSVAMELRTPSVNAYLGLESTDINVSGTICTGLKEGGSGLSIPASGYLKLKIESEDLANRVFYLGSLTSGSVSIVYTKNLA